MRQLLITVVAVATTFAATASATAGTVMPPTPISEPLPLDAKTQRVLLARVVTDIAPGTPLIGIEGGLLCVHARTERAKGDEFEDLFQEERKIFVRTLKSKGFSVADDTDDLFGSQRDDAGILVAASQTAIRGEVCAPYSGVGDPTGRMRKGRVVVDIEWQIYSSLQKKLLAKVSTSGGFEIKDARVYDPSEFGLGAFQQNVIALTASEEFRRLVAADAAPAGGAATQTFEPVRLTSAGTATSNVSDAAGSVVAVFTGAAMGSGFLISDDGYVLTDAHVVGGAKTVKIRWSDGFETAGEVVRTHAARDVALVRTEPHGRKALRLRRELPEPGETVIAIGTPLDEKWQGTITKGVVSANRIKDGFSFIQSDVAIDHGNSGGPLLDEKGAVVGISDWFFSPDGVPHNLNFFIPIGDALDFLALKPQS